MIYIIIDSSYKWSEKKQKNIIFAGTSKEEANKFFDKYCEPHKYKSSETWCVQFHLYEYPDNWTPYSEEKMYLVRYIDNVGDGTETC